jgi:hypothetical protein
MSNHWGSCYKLDFDNARSILMRKIQLQVQDVNRCNNDSVHSTWRWCVPYHSLQVSKQRPSTWKVFTTMIVSSSDVALHLSVPSVALVMFSGRALQSVASSKFAMCTWEIDHHHQMVPFVHSDLLQNGVTVRTGTNGTSSTTSTRNSP